MALHPKPVPGDTDPSPAVFSSICLCCTCFCPDGQSPILRSPILRPSDRAADRSSVPCYTSRPDPACGTVCTAAVPACSSAARARPLRVGCARRLVCVVPSAIVPSVIVSSMAFHPRARPLRVGCTRRSVCVVSSVIVSSMVCHPPARESATWCHPWCHPPARP